VLGRDLPTPALYLIWFTKAVTMVRPHFRLGSEIGNGKKTWFYMIHFDAKHQKSEAKTKVKQAKIKQKIKAKRKLSEKIDKNVCFHPKRNWEAK
jgi:hypothetical protein